MISILILKQTIAKQHMKMLGVRDGEVENLEDGDCRDMDFLVSGTA